MYLSKDETIDNFQEVQQQYIDSYAIRKEKIDSLYSEIKTIKKLKL